MIFSLISLQQIILISLYLINAQIEIIYIFI